MKLYHYYKEFIKHGKIIESRMVLCEGEILMYVFQHELYVRKRYGLYVIKISDWAKSRQLDPTSLTLTDFSVLLFELCVE